jgi:hypothetical protein
VAGSRTRLELHELAGRQWFGRSLIETAVDDEPLSSAARG